MNLDGIRALTFDVVGTLIDFETGILRGVRAVAGPRVPTTRRCWPRSAPRRASSRSSPRRCRSPRCSTRSRRGSPSTWGSRVSTGAGASPLRRSIASWPAFPDAVEALRVLGERFRLVAVTNADRPALDAMAATLGDPFADGVTVDQVGVNKPDPRMFEAALTRLAAVGIGRDEVLHVAQSQYHDIGAAHRLGLATCWVERRRGGRAPGRPRRRRRSRRRTCTSGRCARWRTPREH